MASRMVSRRQKLRKVVAASVAAYATKAHQGLDGLLTPLLDEGETLPDFALVQELLLRLVRGREQEMLTADSTKLVDQGPEAVLMTRRDDLVSALYGRMVEIRRAVSGILGSEVIDEVMRITGSTSRDPEHLVRQVEQVIDHLRNPELSVPPLREADGSDLVLQSWTVQTETLVSQLKPLLEDVETEKRRTITATREKTESMEAFDLALNNVAQILRAYFVLVGMDREAELLRLRSIRRGGSSSEAEPDSAPPPEEEVPEVPIPEAPGPTEVN